MMSKEEEERKRREAERQAAGRALAEQRPNMTGTANLTPQTPDPQFSMNQPNPKNVVAGQDLTLAPQNKTVDTVAPPNVPRLPNGEINPAYVPGINLRGKEGEQATRTSGLPLSEQMRIDQQTEESKRTNALQTAFGLAQAQPLPSLFDPSNTAVNWGGVGFAALNKGLTTGTMGGAAALLGGAGAGLAAGASTGASVGAIGGPVGIAVGVLGGAALGALTAGISELRNQKKDTIKLATASYDRAEGLRRELIMSARQGADPYEIIAAYKQIEQIKLTAREALEFAARRDPSGFSDDARAKLYQMKQQETSELRFIRDQRLVQAMLNPSRDLAPDVQETIPLTA